MDQLTSEDPTHIGPYRLLSRLGAGGMGRVYLARSEGGRTVAVKVVQPELAEQPEFRTRFAQEVAAARRVGGEWTAPVLDADTDAPTPWVATAYVPGPDLHTVVRTDHGPLPADSVRTLAGGLTHALQAIHGAGLIHRDLKPSNVLLTFDGPRVIDFGIARAVDTVADGVHTRTGAIVGSPGFMSPEQVRGRPIGAASDVFCLGSVLAYAATGLAPFGTSEIGMHALLFRVAEEEPDLTGLPDSLLPLVRDCLAKDPAERPSVADLLTRTETPSEVSGPWLPATLLHSLGRHAAQLLDADASSEHAAAPTPPPAPTPAPPPTPPVAQHQPPSPTPGFGPPAAPARSRPKWLTPLAAAVAVAVLAGGGLLAFNLAGQDKDSGDTAGTGGAGSTPDTGSKSPSGSPSPSDQAGPVPPTAGATAPTDKMPTASDIPEKYFGSWYGPIREGEREGDIQRVEIIKNEDEDKGESEQPVLAHLTTYTKEHRLCVQTAYVTSVDGQLTLGLPKGESAEDTAGATRDACGTAPGAALQAVGDSTMRWAAVDGESGALRSTEGGEKALPDGYAGSWRTTTKQDGKKVPVLLQLKQGRAGTPVARLSTDTEDRTCVSEARLFLIDRGALILGPAAIKQATPKNACKPTPSFGVKLAPTDSNKLGLKSSTDEDNEEITFNRVR
ncbi:serine/threonine-protein kinase [Streptomyces triticagri]|uniref:serine/threonine-protein kinase n=1 Tax=Streptomyces triticagri TaxID=2293568 RepID=UPI0026D38962|nr:serine/threonine-protein kinase [Streptomyces triticagri]